MSITKSLGTVSFLNRVEEEIYIRSEKSEIQGWMEKEKSLAAIQKLTTPTPNIQIPLALRAGSTRQFKFGTRTVSINLERTIIKVLTGIIIYCFATTNFAQADTIDGTKHDLSVNGSIIGGSGVCSFCHGAHGNENNQLPLWNRSDPKTTEFTLYSSDTMDASVESLGQESLACLSCHDGTTAFDAYNGSAGTSGNNMDTHYEGSSAILGSDLSGDHPVGVSISADSEGIYSESSIVAAGLRIYSGNVECASCHDAHGVGGYVPFLRLENNDTLCLTCHNK